MVRSSTETVNPPSGTATRYVPAGPLKARNTPPTSRVNTTVTGSVETWPSTVTWPETAVAWTRGIDRSTGPVIVSVPEKMNVSGPWVRFAYTVYVPVATYVEKRPAVVSTTRSSGPSNVTGTSTRLPKNVTDPVTLARWTTAMSWTSMSCPTSRVRRSTAAVCHRRASEPALTLSSTIAWYSPGARDAE